MLADAALLLSGLGFPEGPVLMPDGAIVFCDGNTGELCRWADGTATTYARTGGSPWGAALGADSCVYVAQAGGVFGSGLGPSGIQRVRPGGRIELLVSQVDDEHLVAPNDVAFGPDGRLYVTDSGAESDDRVSRRSPGRLFALARDGGERIVDRPLAYPNGIAFDRFGRLHWTESVARRICRLEGGRGVTVAELASRHVPDGMAFTQDGRMFVCATSSGAVAVLSADGRLLGEIAIGAYPTNCVFDGSVLYVTATTTAEIRVHERTGTLWRVETDAVGLRLLAGSL
jgi:gluconolactonase